MLNPYESVKDIIDVEIIRPQFGTGVVPANNLFSDRDLLEHFVHVFDEVVVHKPSLVIAVIFFKRHCVVVDRRAREFRQRFG